MAHLFVFIGIDPGKTGGVAVITEDGARLISREMPIDKSTGLIDCHELYDTLKFATDGIVRSRVILEQAQSMPQQGVKSTFNYGEGFGRIQAVLELLSLNVDLIRPHVWKKAAGLNKAGKIASCRLAEKLFPGVYLQTPRGRWRDGEAEALLLAEYGRKLYGGIL